MLKLERPIVFFDLETTGVDTSKDRVVQFAAIQMKQRKNTLLAYNSLDLLVNPEMPIPPAASEVHGIYDSDVADVPTFKEQADEIIAFMNQGDWGGYNIVGFDVPLLLNELSRCGKSIEVPALVDSFKIFKEDIPHTLAGAHKHYYGKYFKGAHNALMDVRATVRVFQKQAELDFVPETAQEIYQHFRVPGQLDFAGKLVEKDGEVVLNFGKHKGVPILNVDQSYLQWCKKNDVLAADAWDIIRSCYRKGK